MSGPGRSSEDDAEAVAEATADMQLEGDDEMMLQQVCFHCRRRGAMRHCQCLIALYELKHACFTVFRAVSMVAANTQRLL